MDGFVTIVSGLPRSGTSMMMKMLDAGGLSVVVDNLRAPDEDNPGGYYEFEKVKDIRADNSWLGEARGKVCKMVSQLLYDLPPGLDYKVVFMERNLSEMAASQRKMLVRLGRGAEAGSDEDMLRQYEAHLGKIKGWLAGQPNIAVLYVSYNAVMADPRGEAVRVAGFLGGGLDVDKMAGVLDSSLYRNRAEGPQTATAPSVEVAEEDEEAVKERLKSLGYL